MKWFTKAHLKDKPWSEQPLRFRFYVELLNFGRRLRYLLYLHWFELLLYPVVLFTAWVLLGCTEIVKPEEALSEDDVIGLAEYYCDTNKDWPCGHVYVCYDMPTQNGSNPLGGAEFCVRDGHDMPGADCRLTPVGPTLCLYGCGYDCAVGCNAYDGCYCPTLPGVDAGVGFDAILPKGWP